ncbi:MAG: acyltransferase domain-containing protein [Geodermatophilaceae bacterium]|nr:acyltransferase domain-containing protein [Geodermatophilaceae bacterium]
MLAILAPGQGAQSPGMLEPWLDLAGARERMSWFSAVCGIDLIALGTTADADQIKDTAVTQPLVVALGLLAAEELGLLRTDGGAPADVTLTAGHSVGEITAAAVAGALSPEAAIALAAVRGREMAAACKLTPTGMSALLGGNEELVLARLEELGLTPANRNGAGQIVAAGSIEALAKLAEDPPAKARVHPLSVAGAFHTSYMQPAQEALAAFSDGISASDPTRLLLTNSDGTAVETGRGTVRRLVAQLTAPVRFDACLAAMRDIGVRGIIELPPAGVLTGLVKREVKGVPVVALKTPDDLGAARDMLNRQSGKTEDEHRPDWRMVVAPVRGTVGLAEVAEGANVEAGTPLGVVTSRREEAHLSAGYDGVLAEWLVVDGDLVDAGDPVARLYPTSQR